MKVSDLANELVMYDQDAEVFIQEGAELYRFTVEHSDTPGYQDLVLFKRTEVTQLDPEPEEIDYDAEDFGTDDVGTDIEKPAVRRFRVIEDEFGNLQSQEIFDD